MSDKELLHAEENDPIDRGRTTSVLSQALGRLQIDPVPPKLFSVKQVAESLGLSNDTIYALIKSGQLKAVRLQADSEGSRYFYRIRPEDLTRFLSEAVYNPNEEGK